MGHWSSAGKRLKEGGVTPSPPRLQPSLCPKSIPVPQHQPQPHSQPPVTAAHPLSHPLLPLCGCYGIAPHF